MPKPGIKAKAKKKASSPALPTPRTFVRPRKATDKEALFAKHYAVSRNGRRAAIAAGYAETSAHVTASVLIRKPKVQDLINAALNEALGKAQANVNWVVRKWLAHGSADARELVENFRDACRYCHGDGHNYHWTAREYQRAQERYREALEEWNEHDADYQSRNKRREPKEPDIAGGLGFDPRQPPHHDCPECFGRGIAFQYVADTRHLSEAGAMLYGGLRVTEKGIEVKMRDPDRAVDNLAKHLGMMADRHIHTGLENFDWDKATPDQLRAIAAGKAPK